MTAAAELPWVLAVITHLNAPAMQPAPKPSTVDLASLASGTTVNYLNTEEVHFNGQPVALVVAESIEAAAEGAGLVDVRYETHPAAVDFAVEQVNAVPQKSTGSLAGPSAARPRPASGWPWAPTGAGASPRSSTPASPRSAGSAADLIEPAQVGALGEALAKQPVGAALMARGKHRRPGGRAFSSSRSGWPWWCMRSCVPPYWSPPRR